MKALDEIKKIPANFKAETPDGNKKQRNIGLLIAGVGFGLRIATLFFPATMPVGLASLGTELFWGGLAGLGYAGYHQNKVK